MNKLGILALGVLALCGIGAGAVAAIDYRPGDERIRLTARKGYADGSYIAYAQPWGAPDGLLDLWASRADSIRVDPRKFPQNTRIAWRWPPFGPPGHLSIWGYNHLAYGDYDGGEVEEKVSPRKVKDLQRFTQTFKWSGDFSKGEGTLLTEFYLRSAPQDVEAKVLEIGWFLHMPAMTREFVKSGKQLGTYRDPQGREWKATLDEKYLTFSSPAAKDIRTGSIDIRHALEWLQEQHHITGEEWVTGVAIGVEPMRGFGHVEIEAWQADLR